MERRPQGGSGLHKVRSVNKMRFKAGAFFGEEESSLDVTSRRAKRTSPESGGPRRLETDAPLEAHREVASQAEADRVGSSVFFFIDLLLRHGVAGFLFPSLCGIYFIIYL